MIITQSNIFHAVYNITFFINSINKNCYYSYKVTRNFLTSVILESIINFKNEQNSRINCILTKRTQYRNSLQLLINLQPYKFGDILGWISSGEKYVQMPGTFIINITLNSITPSLLGGSESNSILVVLLSSSTSPINNGLKWNLKEANFYLIWYRIIYLFLLN